MMKPKKMMEKRTMGKGGMPKGNMSRMSRKPDMTNSNKHNTSMVGNGNMKGRKYKAQCCAS